MAKVRVFSHAYIHMVTDSLKRYRIMRAKVLEDKNCIPMEPFIEYLKRYDTWLLTIEDLKNKLNLWLIITDIWKSEITNSNKGHAVPFSVSNRNDCDCKCALIFV